MDHSTCLFSLRDLFSSLFSISFIMFWLKLYFLALCFLIEFLEAKPHGHLPETLPAQMQAIFPDMRLQAAAILAFSQGDPAASFLRLIEFDEFLLLNRFSIQLSKHFFVVAGGHRLPYLHLKLLFG